VEPIGCEVQTERLVPLGIPACTPRVMFAEVEVARILLVERVLELDDQRIALVRSWPGRMAADEPDIADLTDPRVGGHGDRPVRRAPANMYCQRSTSMC